LKKTKRKPLGAWGKVSGEKRESTPKARGVKRKPRKNGKSQKLKAKGGSRRVDLQLRREERLTRGQARGRKSEDFRAPENWCREGLRGVLKGRGNITVGLSNARRKPGFI